MARAVHPCSPEQRRLNLTHAQEPAGSPPPLAGLLHTLLRHWRLLAGLPAAGLVIGTVLVVVFRGQMAEASFSPQGSERELSRISGLVEQLGLPLDLPSNLESVDFYRALLFSRDVLVEAARSPYRFATRRGGTDSLFGSLLDLYEIRGRTEQDRFSKLVRRLRQDISVGTQRSANLVNVRVTAPWAELAEQVARRLLDLVNQFNMEKRQSRAAAERRFTEAQLEKARSELEAGEAEQKRFLERNRVWQDDPQLAFEMQRLTRRVDQIRGVYQTLAQSFEKARIEEVRNTPVVTVVQSPEGSARPSFRLIYGAGLGLFLGGLVAVSIVLLGEYAAREKTANPRAYQELKDLRLDLTRRLLGKGSKEAASRR